MSQPEEKSLCYQADLARAALGKLAADVDWHAYLPSILIDLAKVDLLKNIHIPLVHGEIFVSCPLST